MCYIIKDIPNSKEVSGYKVAIRDKNTGKFYSPATFTEYKKGKIGKLRFKTRRGFHIVRNKYLTSSSDYFFNDTFWYIYETGYSPGMINRTGIFKYDVGASSILCSLNSASELKDRYEYVIVHMTIGGNISLGKYGGYIVYVGSEISEITPL